MTELTFPLHSSTYIIVRPKKKVCVDYTSPRLRQFYSKFYYSSVILMLAPRRSGRILKPKNEIPCFAVVLFLHSHDVMFRWWDNGRECFSWDEVHFKTYQRFCISRAKADRIGFLQMILLWKLINGNSLITVIAKWRLGCMVMDGNFMSPQSHSVKEKSVIVVFAMTFPVTFEIRRLIKLFLSDGLHESMIARLFSFIMMFLRICILFSFHGLSGFSTWTCSGIGIVALNVMCRPVKTNLGLLPLVRVPGL